MSLAFEEELMARTAKPAKKEYAPRPGATRFTTQYAVNYGRRQGWKLIDRENYDFRNKIHHDLQLGLDCLFDDGETGMVGIQGAGKGERKDHYQRFIDRGGVEKARRRGIRVFYIEFVRGKSEPILMEQWA